METNNEKQITNESEIKYPSLILLSEAYRIFAWLSIIGTVFALLFMPYIFFIIIPIGALSVISLFSVSEIIKLFMDMEYNTRKNIQK